MDIKKTLEHCIEWNCVDCPNEDELGSGNIVCRARLFPKILEYINNLEAKLAESESNVKVGEFWHSAYQGKQLDYDKVYAELRQSYDENNQLKQQLEEKDKMHLLDENEFQRYCAYKHIEPQIKGCLDRERELEKKLAESEIELEKQKDRYDKLYGCYKKTSSEDLKDKYRLSEEIIKLKQQLEEKEKEIKKLKLDLRMFKSVNEFINNYGIDKAREVLLQSEKTKKQDKISFAVERLEKVKECIKKVPITDYEPNEHFEKMYKSDAIRQIDNQIKQLNGR